MKTKYEYVDALRGVAVLLVVFTHVGHVVSSETYFRMISEFGRYGVQLFFIMSAFTLCHSIKKVTTVSGAEYLAFMTRRFFRIAPLYYLAIPFYYAFCTLSVHYGCTMTSTLPFKYTIPAVASNFLFLHGLYPAGNNSIVPGGWTIGCEFLFYGMFPYLFAMARAKKWVLAVATVLAVISTLTLLIIYKHFRHETGLGESWFLYCFVSNQFPCFILGMLYFFYGGQAVFRYSFLAVLFPVLLALTMVRDASFGWMLSPTMAGVVAVGLALIFEKISIPKLLQRFGQRSFSIYLVHFVFVQIFGELFLIYLPRPMQNSFSTFGLFLVVAFTSYGVAWLTNHFIEQPFIDMGHLRAAEILERNRR